jgi:mono/diheme cytochrome c family protein
VNKLRNDDVVAMPARWTTVQLSRTGSAVAIMFAALLLLSSCKARTPGGLETAVMQSAKLRITVGGRADMSPLATNDENIHAGQRNFTSYCMICHGLDGQNTGVPFADEMSPPVPSLDSPAVQAYTDGQLHWIIRNGIFPSGMPPAKDMFRDEEIWQMVLFIRHLPAKGSSGDPRAYSGEQSP